MEKDINQIIKNVTDVEKLEKWRQDILEMFKKNKISAANCWIRQGKIRGIYLDFEELMRGKREILVVLLEKNNGDMLKYVFSVDPSKKETHGDILKKEILREFKSSLIKKQTNMDRKIKEIINLQDNINILEKELSNGR